MATRKTTAQIDSELKKKRDALADNIRFTTTKIGSSSGIGDVYGMPVAPTTPKAPEPTPPPPIVPLQLPQYNKDGMPAFGYPTLNMPTAGANIPLAEFVKYPNIAAPTAGMNIPLAEFKYPEIGQGPSIPDLAAYKPSDQTMAAYERFMETMGMKPGAYDSKYQPQMDALYQQMGDRGQFKYDLNADMLYQQMKDQYVRNAQRAMMDAQGQAAGLTGGYGSSAGQMAGQMAYDQHLQALNDNIPALYDRKYNEWTDEGNRLAQQFGMAGQLENLDYGRYRDQVSDWMTQQAMAQDQYNQERGFDYGVYSDDANRQLTKASMESDNYWRYMNAKLSQADAENLHNWRKYEAEAAQADRENENYWKQVQAQMAQADAENRHNWRTYDAQATQADRENDNYWNYVQAQMGLADADANNYWKQQDMAMRMTDAERDAFYKQKAQDYNLAIALLQAGKQPTDEMLASAGIDRETAAMLKAEAAPMMMMDIGGGGGSSGGGSKKKAPKLKTMTNTGWTAMQDAFEDGGPSALLAEADKQRMQGYDPTPALEWHETYKMPQYEQQKRQETAQKAVEVIRTTGSNLSNLFKGLLGIKK